LDKYTSRNRCKILFNHLYFSKLPPRHIEKLLASGAHRTIVRHRNFNPRIIEWMTTILAELPTAAEYGKEFIKNLDQPQRLWEHAYSRQLSEPAQGLLLVLGTLASDVLMEDAERAFVAVWPQESAHPLPDAHASPFSSSLRELDGTFIKSVKDLRGQIVVSFQNPSIRDFVEYKLRLGGHVASSILEKSVFFEQVVRLDEVMRTSGAVCGDFAVRWSDALCRATERTLDQSGCTLSPDVYRGGVQFRRVQYSVEERIASFLEAVHDAVGDVVRPHMDHLLAVLLSKWRDGSLSPENAELVLDAVEGNSHLGAEQKRQVAQQCADALLENEADLATFKAYGVLREKLPQPTEEALGRFHGKFLDSLGSMLSLSGCDGRASAHERIDEVESAATALGLDIAWEITAARGRADEIGEPDYDRVDDESPRSPQTADGLGETLTDNDIDQIFSALDRGQR
jgi:hypothetical protein